MADKDCNGQGSLKWMWAVRIFMMSLPVLFGLLGYYIHTENTSAVVASEARMRATYVSNNEFKKWVEWQYKPHQEQTEKALERIETMLTGHSTQRGRP